MNAQNSPTQSPVARRKGPLFYGSLALGALLFLFVVRPFVMIAYSEFSGDAAKWRAARQAGWDADERKVRAEERKTQAGIDVLAAGAEQQREIFRKAVAHCIEKEDALVAPALKKGAAAARALGFLRPSAKNRERIGGSVAVLSDFPRASGALAPRVDRLPSIDSWSKTTSTLCPEGARKGLADLTQALEAHKRLANKDDQKAAWAQSTVELLARTGKVAPSKAAEIPKVLVLSGQECTKRTVTKYGLVFGGPSNDFVLSAYTCTARIAWISVPDGALLGTVTASGSVTPKRDKTMTNLKLAELNSETWSAASTKANDALAKAVAGFAPHSKGELAGLATTP